MCHVIDGGYTGTSQVNDDFLGIHLMVAQHTVGEVDGRLVLRCGHASASLTNHA